MIQNITAVSALWNDTNEFQVLAPFVWKHLIVCQVNIFYVLGENYVFHLKNPILGDLTALYIQWLTYKCCFSWIFIDDSY